ncbi:hypothetical protein GCM10007338_17700 [Corynebacterium pelargi]|uniref:Uncharacterized protein n=2 Tax=Corynebacterium pelargi TaxID=1471400 RepID=A0A410W671_9CORY|nr:hypothetical protein CPELA_01135 [Corynebacterium pelargi]GGG79782.1 hypothetical protein GCM10007338_17700 [Corynebacterium pelargi]
MLTIGLGAFLTAVPLIAEVAIGETTADDPAAHPQTEIRIADIDEVEQAAIYHPTEVSCETVPSLTIGAQHYKCNGVSMTFYHGNDVKDPSIATARAIRKTIYHNIEARELSSQPLPDGGEILVAKPWDEPTEAGTPDRLISLAFASAESTEKLSRGESAPLSVMVLRGNPTDVQEVSSDVIQHSEF